MHVRLELALRRTLYHRAPVSQYSQVPKKVKKAFLTVVEVARSSVSRERLAKALRRSLIKTILSGLKRKSLLNRRQIAAWHANVQFKRKDLV